jgi:hypothetical protein
MAFIMGVIFGGWAVLIWRDREIVAGALGSTTAGQGQQEFNADEASPGGRWPITSRQESVP